MLVSVRALFHFFHSALILARSRLITAMLKTLAHSRNAIAALADVAGGLVLVRARGVERYLRYFVALGAGF
jgi:uncharacterized protein (UPF0548 family)